MKRLIACALALSGALVGGCASESSSIDLPSPSLAMDPAFRVQPAPLPPITPVVPRPVEAKERVVELGKSAKGTPIKMYIFGEGAAPLLVVGGIHGNEPTGAELAESLMEYLRGHGELWRDHPVAVIPRANPDGLSANTRVNANGVDVNRNFPAHNWKKTRRGDSFGGNEPCSESETRAIVKGVELTRPWAILSLHSISNNATCNNYDGPAEGLAKRMSALNGYPAKATIGYPTPGSMGSWAGIDKSIPIVTLELPRSGSADEGWQANRPALLMAVKERPSHALGK